MDVLKTVKMYVGGAFIRSESGQTNPFYKYNSKNEYARVCVASRKDFRNAVTIAKDAQTSWSGKSAFNRSQILYRMGEMAQARLAELLQLLSNTLGMKEEQAIVEAQAAVDTFIYYAGWCDKYQQVYGSTNPVGASYHNFSTAEHMGTVVLIDSEKFSLQKLVDNICSILVGGNTVLAFVSQECSPVVSTLGEIFETSDVPAGVINLLSGDYNSLLEHIATHMEVRAISFQNENEKSYFKLRSMSINNMKRIIPFKKDKRQSLDLILDFVECKTIWHPIGF